MIEQQLYFNPSSKRLVIIIVIAILIHLICMRLLLHQHFITAPTPMQQPLEDDVYLAQQLLSAGQNQATVTFQHEPPSDEITTREQLPTPAEQDEPQAQTAAHLPPEQAHDGPAPRPAQPKRAIRPLPARQKTTNHDRTKLIELTQGFLKSMQQEAGHNRPAVNDIRQLSLQMYTSKIWHIIKQSFLAEDNSVHLSRPVQVQTQLVVTIDKEGKLRDIALLYPQHMTEVRLIERLIISRAQQAGLFPPLPNSVTAATKSFSFPLFIKGEAGVHSYSLSYQ
jgi:hypothetical protein